MSRPRQPYVAAHRGASRLAPENTIPAFTAALEAGAAALELDVHLTRDDHVVVIHDGLLERTTDGHGPVSRLTRSDVDRLDAGSWWSPEFSDTAVPHLDQIIALTEPGGTRLHIELKGDRAWYLAARVVELVRELGAAQRCIIMSFDLDAALSAARYGPELPVLAIVGGRLQDQLGFVLSTGLAGLNQSASLWEAPTVEAFHAHGLLVHGSLINDREKLDAFLAIGGDMADSDALDCFGVASLGEAP